MLIKHTMVPIIIVYVTNILLSLILKCTLNLTCIYKFYYTINLIVCTKCFVFLDTAHDINTGKQVFLVPEMCLTLFDSRGQLTKVLSVIIKPKLR